MSKEANNRKFTGLNRIFKSQSVQMLLDKYDDGTFSNFIDDWKWIFSYSKRYKKAIAFYLILGIFSSTLSLGSSVISKYLIDIIVGKKLSML